MSDLLLIQDELRTILSAPFLKKTSALSTEFIPPPIDIGTKQFCEKNLMISKNFLKVYFLKCQ